MNSRLKNLKVAIVSDHCFSYGGAAYTTKMLGSLFDNPDYYFLMGSEREAEGYFHTKNIFFSFLNRFPFVKRYYRYTYFLWPAAIESFNLSEYDLVISSSFSVSHGAIVGTNTKHIAYIHTPMRYAWDLSKEYFGKSFFLKRWIILFFLNLLRIWDVSASSRADILITNSKFIKDRVWKYWRRGVDMVIHPPVELYDGKLIEKRENYFVAGAPFEKNKGGEFILECASWMGFELKIIGGGDDFKKFRNRYSKFKNISFLGRVSQREKYRILSHAKGFICAGIEDFGIFPVEAMSCGTPVLAYMGGGYMDSVKDGVNGFFFREHTISEFREIYGKFLSTKWKRERIKRSVERFSEERFRGEMERIILKNIN